MYLFGKRRNTPLYIPEVMHIPAHIRRRKHSLVSAARKEVKTSVILFKTEALGSV